VKRTPPGRRVDTVAATLRRTLSRLGVGALIVAAACRRDVVSVTADVAEGAPPPPPAEASRFSVPLDYDFTAVLRVVEHAVPRRFGSLDSVRMVGNDDHRHYAFVADRSGFTAFADGRLLHLRSTLEYSARGFFKPVLGPTIGVGCGKDMDRPRIVLELATPLTLTSDWHLSSHAELVHLAPATNDARDHCDVSILHHDVTAQVVDAARSGITSHLSDIDKKIGEVDLRGRFADLWTLLQRPIRLTDGVWLILGPEALKIGRVRGTEHVLTVPVTLVAHPLIVTSATEPTPATRALSPLGRDTSAGGFRVSLDGVVDYAAASNAVTLALDHKQITEAGHSVTVGTVTVTPASKGRLSVAVAFTGDATGTLRLAGTPRFDRARREITVPDLDYDLETDSQLINTYSWLRSDALRDTFREKAHVPVDPALQKGRQLLLDGLNRKIGDALTMSATVDSVEVRGLFVTRAGVVVRAQATGQAKVAVRQK
jgi:hypothetical protein